MQTANTAFVEIPGSKGQTIAVLRLKAFKSEAKDKVHRHQDIRAPWDKGEQQPMRYNAVVNQTRGIIRLYGYQGEYDYLAKKWSFKIYDRTFQVGDTVEYDSYNYKYLGTIESIGPKTVTVDENGTFDHISKKQIRRMSLYQFAWRNWKLDLEKISQSNYETSLYI